MEVRRGRNFEKKLTSEVIKCFQESQCEKKKDSFFELVYRFREELLKYCEMRCRRFNQPLEVAEQIAEATFEKYAISAKFDFEKSKCTSVDDAFILYLVSIARNLLTDHYRKVKKINAGLAYTGTESIVSFLPKCPENLSIEDQLKYNVLLSLSHKHRVIYLTYKLHEKVGCNLPKFLLEELREYLNLSQTSIRVYKKEANDKISAALDALNFQGNE
ncbi:MAG: hypothetical protein R8N23_20065 [Reichenbachiella sp.]|uniref:RNA polymerase sigma factor n=1 Tax=Reichenbachiella sp. TaxID=2184521 RepID=UPI002965D2AA|nr:hypothetical protein [Reichenbachiella sp.]MDW3212176.1 hypothetical protein [Reichenbachiella sp.]